MAEESAKAAIFLSYASQDTDPARRIAEALRGAGLEVWFDQDELRGGDEWDRKIRNQIRTCALFVPLISANTQARLEGYFRLEWKLAEDRSHLMARGKPFIAPVCIDDTREGDAHVPDAFLAVQWSRLRQSAGGGQGLARPSASYGGQARPDGDAKLAEFVAQMQRLLAKGTSSASSSASRSRAGGTPALPTIPEYELLRQIGRGSYGDVWLARGATGIWRAIKIVWRERFADAEPFEREWRGLKEFAAISLGESTQMALLHVGRNDDAGFFYYVMELADDAERGRAIDPASYVPLTLTQLRARRTRLPAEECVRYGVELARVLASLHRRGLLHRDIKPSNIILVNGVPKLADIGLVAPVSDASTFVGTEGFVPAEGPGSPSADVFALGKVLYELATGLDRQEFPQLPPELNRLPDRKLFFRLNAIILRACEPVAAKRYLDASALLADLAKLASGRSGDRGEGGAFAGDFAGRDYYRDRVMPWMKVIVPLAGMAMGMLYMFRGVWRPARRSEPKPPAAMPAATTTAVAARQAVAVLPFANLSGDPAQDYFSDGLAEQVLDALARERDLGVPGRTSSFSFKGRNVPAAEIARALNVAQLVEGSVQRAGGRVRINVRLTRATDGFSESLGNFDREATDIFALQDEVARAVVEKLTRRAPAKVAAVLTRNPEAYDAYMRGRALQVRSAGDAPAAAKLFEQAVALDSGFALAWARLSQARFRGYVGMNDRSPAVVDSSREAVDRALSLQPDLPEALLARANWLRAAACDYAAARRDLARAEALQPATAELRFAQCLLARDMDDWPEAIRLAREALSFDPQNGDALNATAIGIFAPRGDYAEADRLYAQAMAIQGPGNLLPFRNRVILRVAWRGPEAALRLIDRAPAGQAGVENLRARVLRLMGRTGEAQAIADQPPAPTGSVASFEGRNDGEISRLAADGREPQARTRAEEIRTDSLREFARGNHGPLVRLVYIQAEIALGHADAALAELEQWRREARRLPGNYRRIFEFNLIAADFYARLGKPEETKALLREILAHGFQPVFSFRPDLSFTDLRKDPAFQELMKAADAWAAAQPDPTDETAPAAAKPTSAIAPAAADKSLVVLPLENVGADPANAAFTDGMHAEIIAALGGSADLKVISRNSAVAVNDARARLPEIASKLGVANVVTGSVRRAGEQYRIVIELRRARDEALLWTKTFAGQFEDVFAIQDEIAGEVARVLQARERLGSAAAQLLTKNPRAYELLLEARHAAGREARNFANTEKYIARLEQVIALDPGYYSAANTLAVAHANAFRFNLDAASRTHHAARAKHWAETAARLMPGGAGDGALMAYHMEVDFDFVQAVVHAERALRSWPNDAAVMNGASYALSGTGRMADAVAMVRRSIALDPLNRVTRENELDYLLRLRRTDEWRVAEAEYAPVAGQFASAAAVALRRFLLTGEMPADLTGWSAASRIPWLRRQRRFAEALPLVEAELASLNTDDRDRLDLLGTKVDLLRALERRAEADRVAADRLVLAENLGAGALFDASLKDYYLASALARLGRAEEAIAAGRRWVEARSATTAPVLRWDREAALARMCAQAGRPRECVELLGRLLRVPSRVTVPALRADPDWDAVRDDPGFKALLADPRNSGPL